MRISATDGFPFTPPDRIPTVQADQVCVSYRGETVIYPSPEHLRDAVLKVVRRNRASHANGVRTPLWRVYAAFAALAYVVGNLAALAYWGFGELAARGWVW